MADDKKYIIPAENKNIQIPLMLFAGIASIILFDNDDPALWETVKKGIDEKFNAMYKRQLYSIYRNKDLTATDREAARLKYLDEVGIPHDFWWPADYEANNYD